MRIFIHGKEVTRPIARFLVRLLVLVVFGLLLLLMLPLFGIALALSLSVVSIIFAAIIAFAFVTFLFPPRHKNRYPPSKRGKDV